MEFVLLLLTILPCILNIGSVTSQTDEIHLQYELHEESLSGNFIGNVGESAFQDEASSYTYSIIAQRSDFPNSFTISDRGILETSDPPLDRDTIPECEHEAVCTIELTITAIREDTEIIKITITILDNNDNPPIFSRGQIVLTLPENTPVGRNIQIEAAEDPDSPEYSISAYELLTGAPVFSLRTEQNPDNTFDVFLVLEQELDRERTAHYPVTIAAYDGNVDRNTAMLNVDVVITDVNDNDPIFTSNDYSVTLHENEEVGSTVLQVTATDEDEGTNGQIVYSFTDRTQQDYGSVFYINNRTGEIILVSALSYDQKTEYSLMVEAKDMDPVSIPASTRVVISVVDVNDHAPAISVDAVTASGHVEISESAPIDTFVALISVEDPDSNENGEFNCSINEPAFRIHNIFSGTAYKLKTAMQLNREDQSQYDIAIVCQDHGANVMSSTARILVSVLDENDSPPIFSKQTYSVLMSETLPVGSPVVQLIAEDDDLGQNSLLEYRPLADAAIYLSVDPITGNVTLRHQLDYEEQQQHSFRVIASDHGVPPMSATATILITVLDEDDELPEFQYSGSNSDGRYTFYVYERLPLGTEIDQVRAVDRDSHGNNLFDYVLAPGSYTDIFYIDPETGRLYTRQALDRETQETYDLTVMAVTRNTPPQTSSTEVLVVVLDTNDHTPEWVFPRANNNTVYVASNAQIYSTVTHINAQDIDTGANGLVTYRLVESTESGFFILNPDTGEVSVGDNLEDLADQMITLTFQAADSGTPSSKVETSLHIVVNKSIEVPSKSSQNLTIVITVAVVSGILTVVLIIAIIVMYRKNKYDPKMMRKSLNNSDQKMLYNCKTAQPAGSLDGTTSQRSGGSTSKDVHVSFRDDSTDNSSVQLASGRTSSYRSIFNNKYSTQSECLPMTQANPGGKQTLDANNLQLHYDNDMQILRNEELYPSKDSDSGASVSDSGRGSNEDVESRRSPIDIHKDPNISSVPNTPRRPSTSQPPRQLDINHPQHEQQHPQRHSFSNRPSSNSQYNAMAPPLNRNSFTQRLDTVLQSQQHPSEHVKPTPPVRPSKGEPVGYREDSAVPVRPPRQSSNANNSNSSAAHRLANKRLPEKRLSRDSYYRSADENSINGETSGTEWSDEEKEYVYYVNSGGSSHV